MTSAAPEGSRPTSYDAGVDDGAPGAGTGDDAGSEVHGPVKRHRIARAEYPAFRRFCLDVDAAVGQELVITHE